MTVPPSTLAQFDISGRSAFVTGGASGIGLAYVEAMAEAGAKVTLSDVVPLTSYTITGEGKGGAAGFAKGGAKVRLDDQDGGTLLAYEVQASVGGKLAQLGSRIIDGFAKKMADSFFDNLRTAVEPPEEAPKAEAPEGKKAGWFRRVIGKG